MPGVSPAMAWSWVECWLPAECMNVAWISEFPVEWLPDVPEALHGSPRMHPTSWMAVLLEEFEKYTHLRLHVMVLRKNVVRDFSFERNGVFFHIVKATGGLRAPSFYWLDTYLLRPAPSPLKP